ncbi:MULTISPECIES: DegQ family serine endoprotease [unclassified Azospirillum]|uniref:DegQ family serine endoprotease n=1 Tax=unclassified Azospirillum TaxID=2630922 RepID=UPI000B66ED8B|nr:MULTISPECIES: DegQ family serine endoprotease [unclassified Azospirillum]SNS29745.1 serine protease Do [Azospirillum sp. RU38E]SNS48170.1 serine protease Do [Azospirillum sp. RU37A]
MEIDVTHFSPSLGRLSFRRAVALPFMAAALIFGDVSVALAQRGAPESFAPLAEKSLPAVVNISTSQTIQAKPGGRSPIPMPEFPPGSPFEEFFKDFYERQQQNQGKPRRAQSLGSGFIIDASGYIVTNNHVIEGADEITVVFQDADHTELKAKLIGTDKETDLALLKVESKQKLTALKWGNSDELKVGDWVVAIGNPFGLGGTVTAGIISARARDIGAGRFDDFLQTDAAINQGNSGGPLVNVQGEIVGINTAIFSRTGDSVGIGFAIPANMARTVIEELRKGGKVRRGWLGVQIQSVTPAIAESMGLPNDKGALVGTVSDGSPAAAAGLKPGDVILSFDGKDVANNRALPRMVAETPVGKKVTVAISRKGVKQNVTVTLAELPASVVDPEAAEEEEQAKPDAKAQQTQVEALGLTLSPVTPALRRQYELAEDAKGVVITKVAPGSASQARQLRPGDLVLEVSQQAVATPADVQAKVDAARKAGQKAVLLLLDRKGEQQFLALPLEAEK